MEDVDVFNADEVVDPKESLEGRKEGASENVNLGLETAASDRFIFGLAARLFARGAAKQAAKWTAKSAGAGIIGSGSYEATKRVARRSSCLLGDTQILMRDDATKAISDIQSGEVILDGNLNPVTVKAVVTNHLYDRQLFEFKNGPVFTDEHLFYADLEKDVLAAASPEHLFEQVPQMKSWNIHPINDTKKLLQFKNGKVSPQTFDFHPYHKMDSNTPVYFLITSGKDGSYIANKFVARHELAKFEDWPFTYATMELVIQKSEIENPVDSIKDENTFLAVAIGLVTVWKSAIIDHVFDPDNIISIDPLKTVAKIPEMITPSKLKLAEYLSELGSKLLHEAFNSENMNHKKKLSLMKQIIDYSDAFFDEIKKQKQ